MDDAMPGAGNITFELDGKDQVLRPSLAACLAISRIGGGLNAAVQRCVNLEIDTICQVLIAGMGLNPTQSKMVPEAVFKTGLIALSAPCIDFINVVANGGRPLPDEEDIEIDEGDPADPPEPASA